METKTQKAINLYKQGKLKESLKIFKNFKLGSSKSDQRILQIAYESLTGKKDFYNQIGIDTDEAIKQAKDIIETLFIK